MKKTWIIILITILVVFVCSFQFMKHVGSTYVYGQSFFIDTLIDFFRFSHRFNSQQLEKNDLQFLEEVAKEVEKTDLMENAGFFQLAYMEKEYNNSIRQILVEEGDRAEAIPVLMYHHLLYEEENTYVNNDSVITVESFKEQMKFLYEEGYYTATLAELEAFLLGGLDLPKKTVVITFDDGYLSNIEYAYPILKEYNFKASNFIISHKLQEVSEDFDPYKLQYLSWKDMVETLDVFTYDNHTHNLHRLQGRDSYLVVKPLEEVVMDLKINKELTGSPYFAYPYGQYNINTLQILELLGIRMAFTTKPGHVKPGDDLLKLTRYGIFPNTTLMDFKEILTY